MRLRAFALAALAAAHVVSPSAESSPKRRVRKVASARLPGWASPAADRIRYHPAPRPTPGEVALAIAHAQLGKPYVWGDEGPEGFDCSGLVLFAWERAGVALPRTAAAQHAALAERSVPRDQLRPGDLVFAGRGRIHHVGLYVGEGRMVHAPRRGRHVEVAPLLADFVSGARPAD